MAVDAKEITSIHGVIGVSILARSGATPSSSISDITTRLRVAAISGMTKP
jgi:hypothetical protein